MRWFAQYQPFTPVIQTLRGLLTGYPIGASAIAGLAWCGGIAAVGYLLGARPLRPRPDPLTATADHGKSRLR